MLMRILHFFLNRSINIIKVCVYFIYIYIYIYIYNIYTHTHTHLIWPFLSLNFEEDLTFGIRQSLTYKANSKDGFILVFSAANVEVCMVETPLSTLYLDSVRKTLSTGFSFYLPSGQGSKNTDNTHSRGIRSYIQKQVFFVVFFFLFFFLFF